MTPDLKGMVNHLPLLHHGPSAYLGFGPYSGFKAPFLATNPLYVLKLGASLEVWERDKGLTKQLEGTNPFCILDDFIDECAKPLLGVGYFSYALRHATERLPPGKPQSLPFPGLFFAFFDHFFVIEPGGLRLCALTQEGERYGQSSHNLRLYPIEPYKGNGVWKGASKPPRLVSGTSRKAYISDIRRVLKRIRMGDVYQVNLSREIFAFGIDPLGLFMAMIEHSPFPYRAFLRLDSQRSVIMNSPELFLEINQKKEVLTAPIKGSAPRSALPKEDARLASMLKRSLKDRAEHLMIVDLMRNDLGRVCKVGSVRTENLFGLKSFPWIHHLETQVRGELLEGIGPFKALGKVFPGGSITGAPKIMAMTIISQLEPSERNVYTGGFGVVHRGHLCLAMAIRTALCFKDTAMYPVGGGIVADSDPENEWEETQTKALPFLRALGLGGGVELGLA